MLLRMIVPEDRILLKAITDNDNNLTKKVFELSYNSTWGEVESNECSKLWH